MKNILINFRLFLAIVFFGAAFPVMPVFGQDVEKIQELQRIIETQQQQLEMQQKQLNEQRQLMQELESQVKALAQDSKTAVQEPGQPADVKTSTQAPVGTEDPVASGQIEVGDIVTTDGPKQVRLSISGHVNRAVNIVDDGKDTDAYYVDNDNNESRVNFVGTARIDDDLTLGSRIELTIAPNKASEVGQDNQETGDTFEQRWTEVSLDSKRIGKLSLGRGFTASYGTASSDLSGTRQVATSTIADLAGGMLFRNEDDDSLTNLRINGAFNDFNGLSRKNRLRYDSPNFYGASLAISTISDDRYDAGLYWGAKGNGYKAAAAAGVADLNEEDSDLQYSGSVSLLHEGSGLNLTLSAGMQERDDQDDATNFYTKAGWLTRFFSFGTTAFSIDYTLGDNYPSENDEGESYSVAAVQQVEEYGAEIYAIYREYSLDRNVDPDVHDIDVFSIGAMVKF